MLTMGKKEYARNQIPDRIRSMGVNLFMQR